MPSMFYLNLCRDISKLAIAVERVSSEAMHYPREVDIPSHSAATVSDHRSARLYPLKFMLLLHGRTSTGSMDIAFGGSEGNVALLYSRRSAEDYG